MPFLKRQVSNFAGGRNGGTHPANIAENELAELINFYVDGDSIRPRRGTRRLSDAYIPANYGNFEFPMTTPIPLHSLYSYLDPATNKFTFVVGMRDRFLLLRITDDPYATFASITATSSADNCAPIRGSHDVFSGEDALGSNFGRWRFVQAKGYWYAVAASGSNLIRGNASTWNTAGIRKPASAPIISEGGTGSMTAANYSVVTTLYNSRTGDESEHSEVSNTLALAANKTISVYTNLGVLTSDFYDTIRVWCTQPGQAGAWFLAAEIDIDETTVVIDVTPNTLVELLDTTNDYPPTCNLVDVALFDDCLFVTDGDVVRRSKYLQYETFDSDDPGFPVESSNGHKIKMLYPHDGRLIVGKTNYLTTFTPTGAGDYRPLVLSNKYGIRSKFAARGVNHIFIFYDGFIIRRSDGFGEPTDISGVKVRDILKRVPDAQKDNLSAEIFPRQELYVVIVPQPDDAFVTLAYNYKTGGWSVFEFGDQPAFIAEGFDVDGNREIYATTEGYYVVELLDDDADDDSGTAIEYSWVSKAYSADDPTDFIELEDVTLLTENQGATGALSALRDLSTTAFSTISAYLYSTVSALKWFALNTRGVLSNYIQIKFYCNEPLPTDFRITSMFLRALVRVGQSLSQRGVE